VDGCSAKRIIYTLANILTRVVVADEGAKNSVENKLTAMTTIDEVQVRDASVCRGELTVHMD